MTDLCPVEVEAKHWKGPQPNTVAEANLCLLKQKRLCDVVFTFENPPAQIEAHQFCLRARSPVFDSEFRGRGSFGERKEIKIVYGTPQRFQQFLEFIYADKFEANISGALELLHLAYQYKVEPLIAKCTAVLDSGMQADNVVEIFQTAHKLGDLDDLKLKALNIMASSLNTLCWDQTFLNDVQEETLICLLRRDDLPLKEVDLFKLVLRWGRRRLQSGATDGDNEALKKTLAPVLPLLRYCTMSAEDFTEVVVPAQLLTPEEVIDVYAYLCGQPPVRDKIAAKRKFNTLHRKGCAGTFISVYEEGSNSGPYDQCGNFPLNECLSFYVSALGPKNQHTKAAGLQRLAITGLVFQWPTSWISPESPGKEVPGQDFSVSVMRFKEQKVSENTLDSKFQRTIYNCLAGDVAEIAVVPPMELLLEMDYCVTVKDIYGGEHGNDLVRFYYSWHTELQEFTHSINAVFGNVEVTLDGVHRNGDLLDFPQKNYECVQTIRGIRVAPI